MFAFLAEFDTRARLHRNKKKQKQQQPHSAAPTVTKTYHDHPPVKEQPRNDHAIVTADPTTAGYVAYRDQDELTSSSSSDSDSDSNMPAAAGTLHDNITSHSQEQSQFGTLLNLDSPPASTTTAAKVTTSVPQAEDDLAAVFGNPTTSVKTANLLDFTLEEQSDNNSQSKLAPPLQANRSASSSIEDLLFGGDTTSSANNTLQQPQPQRPLSASSDNLFGSNVLLQPQAMAYKEPTVIGNRGAQTGNNISLGATTQLHAGGNRMPQKSSSATSLTKDDPFAQFVNLQTSGIPSSQSSTPGSSPWPGTSPYPGGSPRSGGSPIPPTTNPPASNPPRYGGLQFQVMGSQYSQAQKNKSFSSTTATQGATSGGVKKPAVKKPQSTNYTSVIGGREERGIRKAANPTGMSICLLHYCNIWCV